LQFIEQRAAFLGREGIAQTIIKFIPQLFRSDGVFGVAFRARDVFAFEGAAVFQRNFDKIIARVILHFRIVFVGHNTLDT
jgi:hypothetical protein